MIERPLFQVGDLHDGDPFTAVMSDRCEKAGFFSLIRLHAATAKTGCLAQKLR
jgi:hypothetical protein